jgi:hypothetical protein
MQETLQVRSKQAETHEKETRYPSKTKEVFKECLGEQNALLVMF